MRGPCSLRQPGPRCLQLVLGFLSTLVLTAVRGQSPCPPVLGVSSWLRAGSRRWSAWPVTSAELPLHVSRSSWCPWSSLGCPGRPRAPFGNCTCAEAAAGRSAGGRAARWLALTGGSGGRRATGRRRARRLPQRCFSSVGDSVPRLQTRRLHSPHMPQAALLSAAPEPFCPSARLRRPLAAQLPSCPCPRPLPAGPGSHGAAPGSCLISAFLPWTLLRPRCRAFGGSDPVLKFPKVPYGASCTRLSVCGAEGAAPVAPGGGGTAGQGWEAALGLGTRGVCAACPPLPLSWPAPSSRR